MIQEMLTGRPAVATNGTVPLRGKLSAYYRALVQRIQAANMMAPANEAIESIGITSCTPGAGVSTVAFNVAVAAAHSDWGPVLFVDADITKQPNRHLIPEPPALGFADALADTIDPMDCIASTSVENLSIVAGGGKAKYDDLVFDPFKAADLLNEFKNNFKFVVVDIPATTELNGSTYLAGKLDGVVLVIESESSDSRDALRTKHQLMDANANLLGVVLNKRRKHVPSWLESLL
jgi:capsular exopolysaccharide synthesis family protein